MGHQGPCSRLPGSRVIAVEDANFEQVLENGMKRRNEIAHGFVGDVVRVTGFPSVNLHEYVTYFAEHDSVWMDIWVKTLWKFSLALAKGWSNSASALKTLFSISLVKTPSNWDMNVSSFSVAVTDLVLETRVG